MLETSGKMLLENNICRVSKYHLTGQLLIAKGKQESQRFSEYHLNQVITFQVDKLRPVLCYESV